MSKDNLGRQLFLNKTPNTPKNHQKSMKNASFRMSNVYENGFVSDFSPLFNANLVKEQFHEIHFGVFCDHLASGDFNASNRFEKD